MPINPNYSPDLKRRNRGCVNDARADRQRNTSRRRVYTLYGHLKTVTGRRYKGFVQLEVLNPNDGKWYRSGVSITDRTGDYKREGRDISLIEQNSKYVYRAKFAVTTIYWDT